MNLIRLLRLYVRESFSWQSGAFLLVVILITLVAAGGIAQPGAGNQPGRADLSVDGIGQTPGATIFTPVRLSVVDEDQSLVSFAVMRQFEALPTVGAVYADSLAEARQRLADNEILLAMVFPKGFFSDIVNRTQTARLTVLLNERMPSEAAQFVRMLDNATASISAVQTALAVFQHEARPLLADDQAYARAVEAAALTMAYRLLDRASLVQVTPGQGLNTVWFVIAALCCLFAVLPALLVLMLAQQERASGRHERLILSNASWLQLHLAKLLTGLFWLLASFLPLLAVLRRALPDARLPAILLAVVLLYSASGLGCLTLAYRSRHTQALMLTAWFGLLALLFAGGTIYPDPLLPSPVRRIGLVSPARWAFQIIYRAVGGLSPDWPLPLAILGIEIAVLLALARWSLRDAR